MKIGIYCTNNLVYPVSEGEIYANMIVAGQVADTLAEMGEDVTFFAPVGTKTKAKLVTFDMLPFSNSRIYKKYPHEGSSYQYENVMMIQIYNYMEKNDFDIFHSHARPFSTINFAPMKINLPTVLTVHDPLEDAAFKILPLYNRFPNLCYVSISMAQRRFQPNLNWVENVYDGVDLDKWGFSKKPGKHLLFVGRIMPDKGPDIAVQVARKANLPLKLAGTIYPGDRQYFNKKIEPFLNKQIEYLGGISQDKLSALYSNAMALLMPIRWQEPFGLVMIEAMASGTPVIASKNGSVPEILKHKKTGFLVDKEAGVDDYVAALKQIDKIDRSKCREHVEENFSLQTMTKNYLKVYKRIVNSYSITSSPYNSLP